jgi:hypothetical protein
MTREGHVKVGCLRTRIDVYICHEARISALKTRYRGPSDSIEGTSYVPRRSREMGSGATPCTYIICQRDGNVLVYRWNQLFMAHTPYNYCRAWCNGGMYGGSHDLMVPNLRWSRWARDYCTCVDALQGRAGRARPAGQERRGGQRRPLRAARTTAVAACRTAMAQCKWPVVSRPRRPQGRQAAWRARATGTHGWRVQRARGRRPSAPRRCHGGRRAPRAPLRTPHAAHKSGRRSVSGPATAAAPRPPSCVAPAHSTRSQQ